MFIFQPLLAVSFRELQGSLSPNLPSSHPGIDPMDRFHNPKIPSLIKVDKWWLKSIIFRKWYTKKGGWFFQKSYGLNNPKSGRGFFHQIRFSPLYFGLVFPPLVFMVVLNEPDKSYPGMTLRRKWRCHEVCHNNCMTELPEVAIENQLWSICANGSINSPCFPTVGDKLINSIVAFYIPITKDSLLEVWFYSPMPKWVARTVSVMKRWCNVYLLLILLVLEALVRVTSSKMSIFVGLDLGLLHPKTSMMPFLDIPHLTPGQMDTRDHNEYEKILRKMREPGDPKSWVILLISQQWRVWAPGCLGDLLGMGSYPVKWGS